MDLSAKLNTVWASSGICLKEELQELIFPGGISYDRKAEREGLPAVIAGRGLKTSNVRSLSSLAFLFPAFMRANSQHSENKNAPACCGGHYLFCGERGIRTLGTVAHTTVFETVPFNHSGISPKRGCNLNDFG